MSRRKAEMVLELIDRASRPARRFMRLQERLGRSAQKANDKAAKSSRRAADAARLFDRAARGVARAQVAMKRGVERANTALQTQKNRLRANAATMRSGIAGTGRAALLAGGLISAYGASAALAASSFIGPAAQFERFGIQLENLEGSSEKGRKAMLWIEDFATRTPLELYQVVEAYQRMKSFGLDPTNGSLKGLVDTMAANGKGVEFLDTMVLALGKSWTKGKMQGEEIMMMLERGVPVWDLLAEKTGKTVAQLQDLATKGKLGRQEIQLLIDALSERNDGASAKMAGTWDGIMSNLMDLWTKFQRMVMDSGVFDFLKTRLRFVLDLLNEMAANGELQRWADSVATYLVSGLETLWRFGAAAVDTWQALYPWIEKAADRLGGWRNLALAVAAIPLRGVLLGAAFGMGRMALGAALAARSLAGISFFGLAAGAGRFGMAMLRLLHPIAMVKAAMVALRVAVMATGIGAIIIGLALAGTWIYNNWDGLGTFFTDFGEEFMDALGPARPLVEGIIDLAKKLWGVFTDLTGPLDANAETWGEWGRAAGRWVGELVRAILELPSKIAGLASDVVDYFASINLYDAGLAMIQSLWDGAKAKMAAMVEALSAKLTSIAPKWMIDGDAAVRDRIGAVANRPSAPGGAPGGPLRKRARGGSYAPGWLLTGERGPELQYRTKGGYIAHNRALRSMQAMSRRIAAPAANGNWSPQARPAAQYIRASGGGAGGVSVNAPISVTIQGGSGDEDRLRTLLEEHRRNLMDEIEGAARARNRRSHG